MRVLISLFVGSIFGIGLLVSGMTDTTKVRGFLDLFGDWDPTLAFVMGGAILPMAVAWRVSTKGRPMFAAAFPTRPDPALDRRLVIGSTAFGVGWGLVGLCPGPAMASLFWGGFGGLIFLLAMLAGMIAAPPVSRRLDAARA